MTVIEIKNLTKIYKALDFWKKDRVTAVFDVNLTVKKGEVFGLLGLNGAGKTTLMKIILGLLFPTKGSVKLFNSDINDPSVRRRIGYLSELPYFPKYLKAYEILDYFAEVLDIPHKEKKRRIYEVLDIVGLKDKGGVKIKGFSKGMQGRLGLAQAILNRPALLLLDEPMSGLDPMGYKETRDIILDLNKRGTTVFFNSHILSEVERICNRVGILNKGRLVELADVKKILRKSGSMEKHFVSLVAEKKQVKKSKKKRAGRRKK